MSATGGELTADSGHSQQKLAEFCFGSAAEIGEPPGLVLLLSLKAELNQASWRLHPQFQLELL